MIAQGAKNGGKMTITMSKKVTKATLQKTTNSMKFAVNIDTSNLNKGSRVQGFKGSRVQGFKGSRVQGFKGSRVQGFKGSRVQ